MASNDPLAACLSKINNAEKVSKKQIVLYQVSKTIKEVLKILQKQDYIGQVDYEESRRGIKAVINLVGHINNCGAIKPRFKVMKADIEKFEQRYLPAKGFGVLLISTSKGLIINDEAKENNVGGRLIAYCY